MTKCCSNRNCQEHNPQSIEHFGRNRTQADGHNNQCKTCVSLAAARRYAENRDEFLARNKAWRDAHPEQMNRLKSEWRATRHEHESKMQRLQRARALDRSRERERDHASRRRARKRGVPSDGSTYADVLALYPDLVCYLCGEPIADGAIHIDHVIPLARGGHDVIANKRPTHAFCNMSKGAKLPTGMSASQSVINTEVKVTSDEVDVTTTRGE